MPLKERIANIKKWALTQQKYTIDELLKLEKYEYQEDSPEFIKIVLKDITIKNKAEAVKDWIKSLKKSANELLTQESYDYIHADSELIKGVLQHMQSTLKLQEPSQGPDILNLLYLSLATLGAVILGLTYHYYDQCPFVAKQNIDPIDKIGNDEGQKNIMGLDNDHIQATNYFH